MEEGSTSRSGRPPQSPPRGFGPPGRGLGGDGTGGGGFEGGEERVRRRSPVLMLSCCSGQLLSLPSGPTPKLHASASFPLCVAVASRLVSPPLSLAVPPPSPPPCPCCQALERSRISVSFDYRGWTGDVSRA